MQYASGPFQDLLGRYEITCSMSGKGNCYDNAMMESFMGTLRVELVHGSDWGDLDEVDPALFDYIKVFYNRVRLHSSPGYKSPLVYEQQTA